MTCKYCEQYIERARTSVPNFEKACVALKLDPSRASDYEEIVKALTGIGQFGTIRLARRFPFVTDEEVYRMVADTGLRFYWMTLDFWDEIRAQEREKRKTMV